MLGALGAYSQIFLLAVVLATTLVFALPIFLVPLQWARAFRWTVPRDTDLAIYFGRCLGAFILVVEGLMLRAGLTGIGLVYTYQVLVAVALLMIAVHVWGALRGIQPLTETLEIGMYAGLLLLSLLFWPLGA